MGVGVGMGVGSSVGVGAGRDSYAEAPTVAVPPALGVATLPETWDALPEDEPPKEHAATANTTSPSPAPGPTQLR